MALEDRKTAHEQKFAMNEQLLFKAEARCCKLFGLWVAEQLGLSDDDANTYAGEVVAANLEEVGFDDVKRHVRPHIDEKGLSISDEDMDAQLEKFFADAKEQIIAESE